MFVKEMYAVYRIGNTTISKIKSNEGALHK